MKYYFAPMEGLTGYIYRNAHNDFFHGIDKYFSPFIVANQSEKFRTRELNDILPEHNKGVRLVPQVLTNNASDFIHTSKKLKMYGYEEINLNLGCPSGTVVSKGKGSGFLAKREELDLFLDEIFSAGITKISVKTRLGKDQPEEFYELIKIFNKYPMEELIIHPRVQKDFYKNTPNMKIFKDAVEISKNVLCYNGDICTGEDYDAFKVECPTIKTVMIGRGLISNPGLVLELKGNTLISKEVFKEFHDRIYKDYQEILFGDRNVLFKMKEFWFYMISMFTENESYAKKIKKSQRLHDYEEAVNGLFREQEIYK